MYVFGRLRHKLLSTSTNRSIRHSLGKVHHCMPETYYQDTLYWESDRDGFVFHHRMNDRKDCKNSIHQLNMLLYSIRKFVYFHSNDILQGVHMLFDLHRHWNKQRNSKQLADMCQ